ncbi:MAG: TlpA family protein disulfide reductase [Acidobacteriales bacterium]|nr:TlpA family protein disulfide reductase [Terriglobales bacterium]
MSALNPGTAAPEISLPSLNGGGKISLSEARRRGPVVAAFFKVSCPVCQFAFPYLDRIYRAYGNDRISFLGVSQNDSADTRSFAGEYKVTFPIALDDTRKYPASNAYGLNTVPSIFLISPDGKVELASVGWDKKDIEELNRRVAKAAGTAPVPLFKPGEQVPDFKAG